MTRPDFTGTRWRTSTKTNDGQSCVDVSDANGKVCVRDSKPNADGTILIFHAREWRAFIGRIVSGDP
jgi:hypothetical protein